MQTNYLYVIREPLNHNIKISSIMVFSLRDWVGAIHEDYKYFVLFEFLIVDPKLISILCAKFDTFRKH
jgi:hypothetical protein